MKPSKLNGITCAAILICASLMTSAVGAEEKTCYMGAPVTLGKAPNGAIANQKLLDGIGKVGWLKPTIEEPAKGVWVFGGYPQTSSYLWRLAGCRFSKRERSSTHKGGKR